MAFDHDGRIGLLLIDCHPVALMAEELLNILFRRTRNINLQT
jgi:hypothetical protein